MKHLVQDPQFEVIVSSSRAVVWVNGADGSALGRFNVLTGMDVHRSATDQMRGMPECLKCSHSKPTAQDWLEFCQLMQSFHGIAVPVDAITFPGETRAVDVGRV